MIALGIIIAAVAAVAVELRGRRRARGARRLVRQLRDEIEITRADLDAVSQELDVAYLAGAGIVAGLTQERGRAELSEGRAVVRSISHRRWLLRTVRNARLLRGQLAEAHGAVAALNKALADVGTPMPEPEPWMDADRALLEATLQVIRMRNRIVELERAERAHAARSLKRRAAIVRIARAHRRARADLAALRAGGPCADRIDFVNGELGADRAAAFRDHLRDCSACRPALTEDVQLAAQLSTLRPEAQ